MPPNTSIPNSLKTSDSRKVSTPCLAILKILKNITTPTPSLKRDSPTMIVSTFLSMPIFFKIPSTAIGSVGEIKAPNTKV